MMKAQEIILIDNTELVKSIEDRASGRYSTFNKVEMPEKTISKINFWKYKQN